MFSGIDEVYFLHPQYVELPKKQIIGNEPDEAKQKGRIEKTKKDWTEFFTTLGVQTRPIMYVKPTNQNTYRQDEIYLSPIINKIIEESNPNKNSVLLEILEMNWDYYKKFTVNTVWYLPYGDGRYSHRKREEISEWFNNITIAKWLPAKNGSFEEPSNLFLDKPEIREILDDSVSYLNADIKNEDFVRALAINTQINIETIIKAIRNLILTGSNDKKSFDKLYLFLNDNYKGNEDQINTYFRDRILVFIPGIPNEYISTKTAIWKDVSGIFGNHRHYLEKYYRELKDFFVNKIGIPETPTAKDYADILIQISEKSSIENNDEEKI